MKIKFKTIAAAAVMAAVSATASATISTGSSTAPADLLFVAFDTNSGATYVRDLGGITQLSTSQNFSAPASSIFASDFASVDPTTIQWNVVAFDGFNTAVYTTGDSTVFSTIKGTQVSQAIGNVTASLGSLTQLDNPANGYSFANGEYTGSTTLTNQTNGFTLTGKAAFGTSNVVSGQGVGTSQNLLQFSKTGALSQLYLNSSLMAFNNNAAGGYFTLTDAAGDLTWTNASVAAVPLPGAALLFLPGLLGMVGLGRRNKKLAA